MVDEQIEDKPPQSAPGSVPIPAPPASVPAEAIQCEECNNSINPNFIFTDPRTDKHYCKDCARDCENCNEKH